MRLQDLKDHHSPTAPLHPFSATQHTHITKMVSTYISFIAYIIRLHFSRHDEYDDAYMRYSLVCDHSHETRDDDHAYCMHMNFDMQIILTLSPRLALYPARVLWSGS